ncbi:MAG: response regulator transcription factor, partial [Micromonosporaceae bacterium]
MTIRVLLADDQELVRSGLKVLCEHDGDITVVAEAADGAQAVELARRTRPDVVLMDIRMPVLDGIAATRRIVSDPEINPAVRVLVLTTYEQDAYVFEAIRAGASGFLSKEVSPAGLTSLLRK